MDAVLSINCHFEHLLGPQFQYYHTCCKLLLPLETAVVSIGFDCVFQRKILHVFLCITLFAETRAPTCLPFEHSFEDDAAGAGIPRPKCSPISRVMMQQDLAGSLAFQSGSLTVWPGSLIDLSPANMHESIRVGAAVLNLTPGRLKSL